MHWVSEWQDNLFFWNWVHCVCVGPWPFNLFPVVLSLFWSGRSFMALIIRNVKTCALGPPHPLSPSVPVEAGYHLVRAAAWAPMRLNSDSGESLHCFWFRGEPTLFLIQGRAYTVSDSGESLHCFLVGVNRSYVRATSDLWLCIHASNLLPSLPTSPHFLCNFRLITISITDIVTKFC